MSKYVLKVHDSLSKWRVKELIAYCRQYPELKKKAEDIASIKSPKISDEPRSIGVYGGVERVVELREHYISKCELIDFAIKKASDELDYQRLAIQNAVKNNLCYGKSLKFLRRNNRYFAQKSFYATRRKALYYLHLQLLEKAKK